MPPMSVLRAFKRQAAHELSNLTASAIVDLNTRVGRAYLSSVTKTGRIASRDAWDFYEHIGEIHYAIARSARIAGYSSLYAAKLNPDGSIGDRITTGPAAEVVRGLYSPYGGVRGLVARFYTHMKVPGEAHLIRVRLDDGTYDGYDFLAPNELNADSLDTGGALTRKTMPVSAGDTGVFEVPVRLDDYLGRVWVPSPHWVDAADSPLGACADLCEQLQLLTRSVKARLRSRLAQAGLLYLPSEIQVQPDPNDTSAKMDADPLVDRLLKAMVRSVQRPDEPESVVPIIVRGPGEQAQNTIFLTIDREIYETDMKLRAELLDRILTSLDAQSDAVKGLGDSNHWSAWASMDEERRIAVAPDVEMMCFALTRMVLTPALEEAGVADADQYVVWFEMNRAATKANQTEDARQLYDRGAIDNEALRRMSNIPDSDAPDEDEIVRWVGRQVKNPMLMLHGLKVYDEIDWDKVSEWGKSTGPAADSPADESSKGPGVGDPGSPDDSETDTPRSQRPQ